jgi:hypothetical protein
MLSEKQSEEQGQMNRYLARRRLILEIVITMIEQDWILPKICTRKELLRNATDEKNDREDNKIPCFTVQSRCSTSSPYI